MRDVTTTILAVVLAGASPLLAQTVADAIADLQRPELAVAACSSLQRQGIAAVMPLRLLLQQSRREGAAFDQGQLTLALLVLGRLGPLAVSALPEVQQLYRDQGPASLRNQALWALGELALGSGDLPTCRACEKLLVDQWTQDLDPFLGAVVRRQLTLGPMPDAQQLLRQLQSYSPDSVLVIAAARTAAAGRVAMQPLRAHFWQLLATAMHDAMLMPQAQAPWSDAAGDLAVALADRGGLANEPIVQRGLLRFWDPDRRRIALAQLIEHPELAAVDRADVVSLLFDPSRAVRLQAVHTLQHWGSRGLVGLLGLRLAAATGDAGFAAACREAADAVLASARAGLQGKVSIELLAELDGIARGMRPAVAAPFDAEAMTLWAEVTAGARVAPAATCSVLLDLGLSRGATGEDAALAAASAMYGSDRDLLVRGLQFLARIGPPAAAALDLDALLVGVATCNYQNRGAAFECKAWVTAGHAASVDELRAALAHPMVRVRLRAVVELARRGALPPADVLARVGVANDSPASELKRADGCRGAFYLGYDRLGPWRDLILGLCGAAGSDTAAFRQLVHERFAVPIDDVPGWVAEVRASGQLHQRLLEVEAMLRRDLKVDERIAPR